MPDRQFTNGANKYRYGFNGQEKDGEISSGATTAEFWEYDARIGRRWNRDPKPNAEVSDYACFNNNPILKTDVNGDVASVSGDKTLPGGEIPDNSPLKSTSKVFAPNKANAQGSKWSINVGTSPGPANYIAGDKPVNGFKVTWNAADPGLFNHLNFGEWSFDIGFSYKFKNTGLNLGISLNKEKPLSFASGTYLEALSSADVNLGYIYQPTKSISYNFMIGGGARTAGVINSNGTYTPNGINYMAWNPNTGASYLVGGGIKLGLQVDYQISKRTYIYMRYIFNSLIGKDIDTNNGTEKYNMMWQDTKLGINMKFNQD